MTTSLEHYNTIVLGAGISGLASAKLLAEDGPVLIIEASKEAGGLHKSIGISQYTFDIGAIFFEKENSHLLMFPSAAESCVPVSFTTQRVTPNNNIEEYPFDVTTELLSKPLSYLFACILSLAVGRFRPSKDISARDYAVRALGEKLYKDSGLEKYIERLCGIPPEEVDIEFAHRRMSWVGEHTSVKNIFFALVGRLNFTRAPINKHDVLLARPADGFGNYYLSIVRALTSQGIKVIFETKPSRIEYYSDKFVVYVGDATFSSTRLISTVPIRDLCKLTGIYPLGDFRSSILTTLFFSFSGNRGFSALILYNFHPCGRWKRLTMHSDYYGKKNNREYFSVECTSAGNLDPRELTEDFRIFCDERKLFVGDLAYEGHYVTHDAYPIYELGLPGLRDKIIKKAETVGIEMVGRQGRFDYIPHSDVAVMEAKAIIARN